MKSKGYSIRRKWTPEEWWAMWESRGKRDSRVDFRRAAINEFRRQLDVASPRPATDGSTNWRGNPNSTRTADCGPPPSIPWTKSETANLHDFGKTEGLSEFIKVRLPRIAASTTDDACSAGSGSAGNKVEGCG